MFFGVPYSPFHKRGNSIIELDAFVVLYMVDAAVEIRKALAPRNLSSELIMGTNGKPIWGYNTRPVEGCALQKKVKHIVLSAQREADHFNYLN